MNKNDFLKLPKVELHCHLDGVIDPPMLRDFQQQGMVLPISPDDLEVITPSTTFEGFQNWYTVTRDLRHADPLIFKHILRVHIDRLKAQNVVYTELMLNIPSLGYTSDLVLKHVRLLRNYANTLEDGKIQIEFLMGLGRKVSTEIFTGLTDICLQLQEDDLIVGVALCGNEVNNPVKPFHNDFKRFKDAGLGIEIHAGEWCGPESVWDALEYGFPDRIGHGVTLFNDSKLIKKCHDEHIHIEMCPTSNLRTGSINDLGQHPIQLARELGFNFGVNTDDPGTFMCSMDSEYKLLNDLFGFDQGDFYRIYRRSLDARFQPNLRYIALSDTPTVDDTDWRDVS